MSRTTSGAVIHRNVALIACDTSGTLQETVHKLGALAQLAVPVGDRHLLMPASRAREALEHLRSHGQFPRLVGGVVRGETAGPRSEDSE